MALSDAATRLLAELGEEYVGAGYPPRRQCCFTSTAETRLLYSELAAHAYLEPRNLLHTRWSLTEEGLDLVLNRRDARAERASSYHHHGDVLMGGNHTTNISGSTIGAVAIGDHATATGTITVHDGPTTQAQHLEHIKAAKKALVDDEDRLDTLVYEALNQFLRLAHDIQVEQKSLAEVQAKMKDTLDEVWAHQMAKGMKPQFLPTGLEVVGALARSEVMGLVVKKLVGDSA